MSDIHICYSRKDIEDVFVQKCPSCERENAQFYAWAQEWYGWHLTCLECGEQFADGEWLERPWSPGWREKNILKAFLAIDEMKSPKEPLHMNPHKERG